MHDSLQVLVECLQGKWVGLCADVGKAPSEEASDCSEAGGDIESSTAEGRNRGGVHW